MSEPTTDALTSRVLRVLRRELDRDENRQLVSAWVYRPVVECVWSQVQPALWTSVLLVAVLAAANVFIVWYLVFRRQ